MKTAFDAVAHNVELLDEELIAALTAAHRYAVEHPEKGHLSVARRYIEALPDAVVVFGLEGLRSQLPYVLANLGAWMGPEARAAKRVFTLRGGIS